MLEVAKELFEVHIHGHRRKERPKIACSVDRFEEPIA